MAIVTGHGPGDKNSFNPCFAFTAFRVVVELAAKDQRRNI